MKTIRLTGPASTDAGEYRDAGALLSVGAKADISAERAQGLVDAGRAVFEAAEDDGSEQ